LKSQGCLRTASLIRRKAIRRIDAAPQTFASMSGAGQTDFTFCPIIERCLTSEETAMGAIGAVFQPELIKLMKEVLDEAAATLPESKRTSTMSADMASRILACAAKGERDRTKLKAAALLAVVECSHYSHDISPERRAV
jgi:hypothetical protein